MRRLLAVVFLSLAALPAFAQPESEAYTRLLSGRRNIYRVTAIATTPLYSSADSTQTAIGVLSQGRGVTAYEVLNGMVAVATYEDGAIGWVKVGTVTVGSTTAAQLAASVGASDPAVDEARRKAEGAGQGLAAYIFGGALLSGLLFLAFSAF